jgi:hypothetical protein
MRTAMPSVTQLPSWVYQRFGQVWARAALAAGWAMLYVVCDASVDAFLVQWRIVLAASIFVGGMYRPVIAYAVFIAAIAYPLYLISIYLMALALAVLILSAPALVARPGRRGERRYGFHMGLSIALAVLAAPLLAPVHLTPAIPLLAGLWWGRSGGAWAGGLSAVWLKICATMSGYSPDLWRINGWSMAVEPIYERFHTANSLQTLVLLFEPLASGAAGTMSGGAASPVELFLLFNLLQVFAWAGAGYVVGSLMRWLRTSRERGWKAALSLGPGILMLWAGYVAVPSWLQIEGPRWFDPLWLPAQIVLAGIVTWGLDGLVRYLNQPIVAGRRPVRAPAFSPPLSLRGGKRSIRWRPGSLRRRRKRSAGSRASRGPVVPPSSSPLRREGQKDRAREQEDIIMIELD